MRLAALTIAAVAAITLSVASCDQTASPAPPKRNETVHEGLPPKRFQGDVDVGVRFVANPAAECYEAGAQYLDGELKACVVETIYKNKVTGEKFSNYTMIVKNPCLFPAARNPNNPLGDYCHEIGHVNTWSERHEA